MIGKQFGSSSQSIYCQISTEFLERPWTRTNTRQWSEHHSAEFITHDRAVLWNFQWIVFIVLSTFYQDRNLDAFTDVSIAHNFVNHEVAKFNVHVKYFIAIAV